MNRRTGEPANPNRANRQRPEPVGVRTGGSNRQSLHLFWGQPGSNRRFEPADPATPYGLKGVYSRPLLIGYESYSYPLLIPLTHGLTHGSRRMSFNKLLYLIRICISCSILWTHGPHGPGPKPMGRQVGRACRAGRRVRWVRQIRRAGRLGGAFVQAIQYVMQWLIY